MGRRDAVRTTAKQQVRWLMQQGVPRLVIKRALRKGDPQARFVLDTSLRENPYPFLAGLRQQHGRLVRGAFGNMTVDHAMARDVLRSDDMSVAFDVGAIAKPVAKLVRWSADPDSFGPIDPPSLLAVDPPAHTHNRALVSKVFTARNVQKLRDRTVEVAGRLLDEMERAGGSPDLVAAYATQLPVRVICDILGVQGADQHRILSIGEEGAPSLDIGLSYRQYRRVQRALREGNRWIDEHLTTLRGAAGEDLLSQLVNDGQLNQTELRSTALLLLAAGFETTVNLLGSGTRLLASNPDQLALLREDPGLWPNAVEEILRFESPVQVTGRTVMRDCELQGEKLARGAFVVVSIGGCNRDPAVFDDPDRFDVTRANAKDHLSFSGGRHFCLGASLARMEGEVGLQLLFERFPDLALRPGATRRETRVLRGWKTLPVELTRTRDALPAR